MPKPKLNKRQKQALADPVTQAAEDAALAEARQRFDPQMDVVIAEIKALLAGRHPADLSGGEAVMLMGLKARFDALAIEQQEFAGEALASRLDPPEGNEPVEPRPRVLT
jgi:hypothetical protein